jgi:hypothetical protein
VASGALTVGLVPTKLKDSRVTTKLTDDQLHDAILALVDSANRGQAGDSPLNRLQVRINDHYGGDLHDPEEVLRQVSELVLGGLEITDAAGERRRISFDGGQLARAFADATMLEFMKVEISYIILGALGEFIFARTEVGAATQDVRETLESLQGLVEGHLSERINTLGGQTQQRIIALLREALGEETERKLIRIEQEDRRRKKQMIRDLTRQVLDAFGEGMEEFLTDKDRFQKRAEEGFEGATSLPAFNRILEQNLCRIFDLIWALRFKGAIEQVLTEYETQRAISGFDVIRALDYSQSRVIPQAREAFVGMLMGTYKPRARFVRGSSMIAAKVDTRRR